MTSIRYFQKARRIRTLQCVLFIALLLSAGVTMVRIFLLSTLGQEIQSCVIFGKEAEPSFQCDFKPPLVNNTVVLTFTNSGFLKMTQNWLCSLERVGIRNPLVYGLDKGVCSHMDGVATCVSSPFTSMSPQAEQYGSALYKDMMVKRTHLLYQVLDCGHDVLFSDNDVYFFKNPLEYIPPDYDLVVQQDSIGIQMLEKFPNACGGFMFIRSNERTKSLLRRIMEVQSKYDKNDQLALNVCLRKPFSISWTTFERELFPDGLTYYGENNLDNTKIVAVHSNWVMGYKRKVFKMKKHKLWCLPT